MSEKIESMLHEERVFRPSAEFAATARLGSLEAYRAQYAASISDAPAFWAQEAAELTWQQPWTQVLDWQPPHAKWFVGGTLNVCENCVDRHALGARRDKVAIYFEGEPGDTQRITYGELHSRVQQAASMLQDQGVKAGDRVIIYMPMVPEAAIAMLACARIGAVHSVIFGGFSAQAIYDRVLDSGAVAVITADGGWRRAKIVPLKANVDAALAMGETPVRRVIVLERTKQGVPMVAGRDVWWHEATAAAAPECPAVGFDSESPLFILYTSGSTGKPKGILHTMGGYAVGTYVTSKYVFDLREDDIYWCTADVGWVTGHSYIVYGPLANGASVLMFEGAPDTPHLGRFWEIVQKYRVSILYTAPTAIRSFIKWGDEHVEKFDLSSLRLLGSVGEPINPEAWMWYHQKIGGGRCPIVDTWWQTETGAILISPLPGATPTKPGTATLPFFGIDAAIVDETGQECGPNEGGRLVIRQPWPSMLRTLWGDDERYQATYWAEYPGWYLTGDGARRDEDGYFWIIGRLDDVLNVSGHRLGTAEVESALVSHPAVAEAAVVGRPDEIKGQAPVAFVTVKAGVETNDALAAALKAHVTKEIGAIARPDEIRFTAALPKTRSGKIMRRILKEICAGGAIKGDITTLEDFAIVAALSASGKDEE
jgi:acetyl-CoA synthetase